MLKFINNQYSSLISEISDRFSRLTEQIANQDRKQKTFDENEAYLLAKATHLIKSAEIGRARRSLSNKFGVADSSNQIIKGKIADKYPQVQNNLQPLSDMKFPPCSEKLCTSIADAMRKAPTAKATGADGWRNGYLNVLGKPTFRPETMYGLAKMLAEYVCGQWPQKTWKWFGDLASIPLIKDVKGYTEPVRMPASALPTAQLKRVQDELERAFKASAMGKEEDIKIRPVGIGSSLIATARNAVVGFHKQQVIKAGQGLQVALMKDGIARAALDMQTLADANKGKLMLLSFDLTDAFQNIERKILLQKILQDPELAAMSGPLYMELIANEQRVISTRDGPLKSEEGKLIRSTHGITQGSKVGTTGLCITLNETLIETADMVKEENGTVRGIADDVLVAVSPLKVAQVTDFFKEKVQSFGGHINLNKSKYYLNSCRAREEENYLQEIGMSRGYIQRDTCDDQLPSTGEGLIFGGIPIGDENFITLSMQEKMRNAATVVYRCCGRLKGDKLAYLWPILHYSLQKLLIFHYRVISPTIIEKVAGIFTSSLHHAFDTVRKQDPEAPKLNELMKMMLSLPFKQKGLGLTIKFVCPI